MYALIGGSGFEGNDVIRVTEEVEMTTPYGAPSAPIVFGTLGGVEIAFLRRHGVRHEYAPHRVPYRANLWALSKLKLSGVIAVGTVGGIAPALGPGALAVPDQLIDYTWGREVTYFDSPETGVRHVDMTWPFDRSLSRRLVMAAGRLGVAVEEKGVYAATQGPRLETAAEVERMRRDGADMIGMGPYVVHHNTPLGKAVVAQGLDSAEGKRRRLELGLKMIAVTRLFLPDVNIASTTALQALHPMGRELGLKAGANVLMPIVTVPKFRSQYLLYDNKPCVEDTPGQCKNCLAARVASVGDTVGLGQWGDSPHFFHKQKT